MQIIEENPDRLSATFAARMQSGDYGDVKESVTHGNRAAIRENYGELFAVYDYNLVFIDEETGQPAAYALPFACFYTIGEPYGVIAMKEECTVEDTTADPYNLNNLTN